MTVSSPASPVNFSIAQRVLHWATVLLIAWQFIVPSSGAFHRLRAVRIAARKAAEVTAQGGTPDPVPQLDMLTGLMVQSHFLVGMLILALTVCRLWLRFRHGAPAAPESEPMVFRLLAKITHAGIYAVLLAMPMSGIAFRYFQVSAAHDPHVGPLKMLLVLLVVLHVGGALVHQFIWKTDVVARMTKGV